ncbi:twin-arginine translocase subunit TatC [Streptacidiphilus anmyonensis]|uniref:twin-arginine translocase subunit TatC n=1 Tax=Streptacidiphilus anmyonensis TaxID=405782 RepID=UPI0005A8C866|nr:twin-arginine translocase subunit TatC [Streptacidiphilus anmyonensis]
MQLADHLRELRTRLLVCVAALLVTGLVGWLVHDRVIDLLTGPACAIKGVHGVGQPDPQCPNGLLVNQGVLAPLSLTFKVAMTVGLVLASPVWSYQLWAFVAPGLYKKEKRFGLGFTAAAVPLFCLGGYLAYWTFPKALAVLAGLNPGSFSLALPGDEFLDFFIRMVLVFGLSFELPLLLVALNFAGVLSAARLRRWWRGAVLLIFTFSAMATPTGDPLTMTVLAAPICLLFFAALAVATLHDRRRVRRRAADPAEDPEDPEEPGDDPPDPVVPSDPALTRSGERPGSGRV